MVGVVAKMTSCHYFHTSCWLGEVVVVVVVGGHFPTMHHQPPHFHPRREPPTRPKNNLPEWVVLPGHANAIHNNSWGTRPLSFPTLPVPVDEVDDDGANGHAPPILPPFERPDPRRWVNHVFPWPVSYNTHVLGLFVSHRSRDDFAGR